MSTWLKQRGDIFFKWCLVTEEATNKFGENGKGGDEEVSGTIWMEVGSIINL